MGKPKAESHLIRNLLIGLGGLLALYVLAGFMILPWWLEKILPEQLEQRMGWQAEVSGIHFNPFAFSLEAEGFAARDGGDEPVAGFEKLRVDVSVLKLFRGILGFDEIRLTEPDIRLDLLDDFSVNFARDWQNANPSVPVSEPAQGDDNAELPKLYFKEVAIDGGRLLFRDFSQAQAAEFQVAPLDLTLSDLATWSRGEAGSRYSVIAAIGDQTIEWDGELSISPLYSEGRVKLSDVGYSTLAHFLAPYLPWQLQGGSLTVESDYWLSNDRGFELATSNGRLNVQDFALALAEGDDESALSVSGLSVEGVRFDLATKEAQVGLITIDQPFVSATRGPEGTIDWLASLPEGETEPEAEQNAGASGAVFRWSVQGLEVNEGRVRWRDQAMEQPAELELVDLTVTLGGLSERMDEPVSYSLSAKLASGGQLAADGQVTPAPFNFEAALSGSDILLAVVEPYLQLGANLALEDGKLGFDGNLDLDGQDVPVTGTFSGTAQIADLDLRLPNEADQLVSWQLLRLSPVEFNVNPVRLEIGTVTLAQPSFNLIRTTDGTHNVERIVKTSPETETVASQGASASDVSEARGAAEPEFIFRVGELLIENGSVGYTDRTLDPAFSTTFDALSGSVTGISNVPPQQGTVNLSGKLAGGAPVKFEGSLGALGTEEMSNLKLTMEDLALPILSPYLGRYLGYTVDGGKLKLELDYEITGSHLQASNQVIFDQMKLGQAVASEDAVGAPVKLGLALLTDQQGIIEVDLPIEGDMSDPSFRVGQIVMRTFVNLLVKAAASPFSMLGSLADLAGFSSEELGRVSFLPGRVTLADGEAEKISALAKALNERPDLLLSIRGGTAPEADGLTLLKDRMDAQGEAVTEEAWAQARQEFLAGERQLPPETLGTLAAQRGHSIKQLLEDAHGVSGSQLFTLDPARDAELDEYGHVIVPFTLDVR
ncbi:DUF748 domain-containing protein [Marinobacter sp.]|uniref:DUF748 domain-containing protein n=1 Tax=Marinobacter sp. TaxID=50741 RepID=UPI003563F644